MEAEFYCHHRKGIVTGIQGCNKNHRCLGHSFEVHKTPLKLSLETAIIETSIRRITKDYFISNCKCNYAEKFKK